MDVVPQIIEDRAELQSRRLVAWPIEASECRGEPEERREVRLLNHIRVAPAADILRVEWQAAESNGPCRTKNPGQFAGWLRRSANRAEPLKDGSRSGHQLPEARSIRMV